MNQLTKMAYLWLNKIKWNENPTFWMKQFRKKLKKEDPPSSLFSRCPLSPLKNLLFEWSFWAFDSALTCNSSHHHHSNHCHIHSYFQHHFCCKLSHLTSLGLLVLGWITWLSYDSKNTFQKIQIIVKVFEVGFHWRNFVNFFEIYECTRHFYVCQLYLKIL